MSKIDELRRELAIRAHDTREALDEARAEMRSREGDHIAAAAALSAHDEAVAAMREDSGATAPNGQAAPRQRRNLEAATLGALTGEPQSLDSLAEKVGNVKSAQIEAALKRLSEGGKATPHMNGMIVAGWVRAPEGASE